MTVTLHNSSVFPLRYTMVPIDIVHTNFNNQSPFSVVPPEAEIAPGDDFPVKVFFRPDHARHWPFHQRIKVDVPNQVREHTLFLSGRAESRQMYARGSNPATDSTAQLPESLYDPLAVPTTM